MLEKVDIWARRHTAKFAPNKFELIHFTNPDDNKGGTAQELTTYITYIESDIFDYSTQHPESNDQIPVRYNNDITIQPSGTANYLGI